MERILIAGVGNVVSGEDAFGGAVIRSLQERPLPGGVTLIDFGIRSYDLACALTSGYDAVIIVDAASLGRPPGLVCLIEPNLADLDDISTVAVDASAISPVACLKIAQSLGKIEAKVYIVGCEPDLLEYPETEASVPVQTAVPQAIEMIESLVQELLHHTDFQPPALCRLEMIA